MYEEEVVKKMKRVKNVIIYNRIGSDKYGRHSLDVQEQINREFAFDCGLNVLESVSEVADGYLGMYSRPGLLHAMETARLAKHCVVLVSDVNRLSRCAGFVAGLIGESRARLIAVKHGLYYKTLSMQFAAIMAEEEYRQKCEREGREMVKNNLEGKIRFAQKYKPLIQDMLRSVGREELENMLGIGSRWPLPNINNSCWGSADIDDVLNLG